jgi:hypothetical protein
MHFLSIIGLLVPTQVQSKVVRGLTQILILIISNKMINIITQNASPIDDTIYSFS